MVWAAVTGGGRGARPRARWRALIAATVVAGAASTYDVGRTALSEPLFVVVVLALLTVGERWWHRPSRAASVALGLLGGLAVSTRYLGVAAVIAVVAVVLAARLPWRRAATHLAIVVGTALGPLVLWLVTAPDGGSVSHVAPAARRGGPDEVGRSLHEAGRSLLDLWFPEGLMATAGIVVLVGPFVALAVAWHRGSGSPGPGSTAAVASPARWRVPAPAVPWGVFLVLYGGAVVAQRWWIGREVLARYWLPHVAVGVVVVAHVVIDSAGTGRERPSETGPRPTGAGRRTPATVAAVLALVAAALVGVASVDHRVDQVRHHRDAGSGRTSEREASSATIAALIALDPGVVHTDDPPVVRHHLPDAEVVVLDRDRFPCSAVAGMYRRIQRDVDLERGDVVALLTEPCRDGEAVDEVLDALPGAEGSEADQVGLLVTAAS